MKISELIQKLETLKATEGDLEVFTYDYRGFSDFNREPKTDFIKILKGRESRPDKWQTWNGEDRKGNKVCSI